ncbi:MAG: hypothetical protein SGPRY_003737, partial [Prymnesium sp.]
SLDNSPLPLATPRSPEARAAARATARSASRVARASRSRVQPPSPPPVAADDLLPPLSSRPARSLCPCRPALPGVRSVFEQAGSGDSLYSIALAPLTSAQTLLAGVASLDAAIHVQTFSQPLPPVLLYQGAALHFYRAFLFLSLLSICGVWLRALPRARSSHYLRQPLRKWLDALSVLLFVSIAAITFGMRQLDWDFSARSSRLDDPYFLRISLPEDELEALRFEVALNDSYASRVVRACCCWVAAFLACVPSCDGHYQPAPAPPLSRASVLPEEWSEGSGLCGNGSSAWGRAESHVLAPSTARSLVPTCAIGFWSIGAQLTPPPPQRASDGGPALPPLGAREMDRRSYSYSVMCCMVGMLLDVFLFSLCDSIHYTEVLSSWRSERTKSFVIDIVLIGINSLVRLGIEYFFISVVMQTAHYKLGRHAELWKDFNPTFKIQILCYFSMLSMRVFRMIRSFQNKTSGPDEHTFWWYSTPTWIYTVLVVINGLVTLVFYVQSIDALRRLARPYYYLHPEQYCHKLFGSFSLQIHQTRCRDRMSAHALILTPTLALQSRPQRPVGAERREFPESNGETELLPCRRCGRTFFPERLRVHERVCRSSAVRALATQKSPSTARRSMSSWHSNWRRKHSDFQRIVRSSAVAAPPKSPRYRVLPEPIGRFEKTAIEKPSMSGVALYQLEIRIHSGNECPFNSHLEATFTAGAEKAKPGSATCGALGRAQSHA